MYPLLSQQGPVDSGHWNVKCTGGRKNGMANRFALGCWNIFKSFPLRWYHLAKHLFVIIFFHFVNVSEVDLKEPPGCRGANYPGSQLSFGSFR